MIKWLRQLHTHKAAPWVALLVSGGLLVGAWIFQYGFGYAPCVMCYWQRHAHKAVIAVAILVLLLRRFGGRVILHWVIVLAFLVSFGIAGWHVAVEFGFMEGPQICSAGGNGVLPPIDPNDPLAFLDKTIKPPACSEPVWFFLGLSMAVWNALISLIAAGWIATSRKS